MKTFISQEVIEQRILLIRGHKVMLNKDLADYSRTYGTTAGKTKPKIGFHP